MAARKIAWTRINFSIAAIAISLLATVMFGTRLNNDPDTVGIIATVFSILSGVLIAVVSILGDPSMIMDQSWRHSYIKSEEVQRKLHRNTDIFVLYVILLASSLVFVLMDETDSGYFWMQHACFFLVVLAFMASLSLPFSLKKIQSQRLAEAIKSMSKGNGK